MTVFCFFGKNGQILDKMIEDLKREFDLKHEGDVGAFLGIDIVRNENDGSSTLKQPYLIKKVLDTGCGNVRMFSGVHSSEHCASALGRLEDSLQNQNVTGTMQQLLGC